jgi:thermitase
VSIPESKTVEEALEEILQDPNVLYAEPNYIFSTQGIYDDPNYQPNDPYYNQQWGMEEIFAIDAWAFAEDLLEENNPNTPAQVIVAVIDTGVDINHEDLVGKVVPGRNFISGAPNIYDVYDDSVKGHGTHIAGIIASGVDNDLGIAGVAGSLPVKIMPVKVLDHSGTGTMYDISQGIRWAADNGADIINSNFALEKVSSNLDNSIV